MPQMQFMQDNAPAHRAFVSRDLLRANNVQAFGPWPAKSLDINPIENLWDQIATSLQNRQHKPRNRDGLWRAVQQRWNNINLFDVRRMVVSMRRRCNVLIQAAGHHDRSYFFISWLLMKRIKQNSNVLLSIFIIFTA